MIFKLVTLSTTTAHRFFYRSLRRSMKSTNHPHPHTTSSATTAGATKIFTNRALRLDRIQWVGFDLDYTLAIYKNPEYDDMTYSLLVNELVVGRGYPEAIKHLRFDPEFITRGVVIDVQLGNILKLDKFSSILVCYHGRTRIPKTKLSSVYPSLRVSNEQLGSPRFTILNTTYSLSNSTLWADLISYFEDNPNSQEKSVNYKALWEDICSVSESLHSFNNGLLKRKTLEEISTYVENGSELAVVLHNLCAEGKKLFLLTNSPWFYVDGVMKWLLDMKLESYKSWIDYFEVIIVNANKPRFFDGHDEFREVSCSTGNLKISSFRKFEKNKIYSGGNLNALNKLCNITAGNDVLYVGDHIFSDVMISKKKHGWRTLLIIPELSHELEIQNQSTELFQELLQLHFKKTDTTGSHKEIEYLKEATKKCAHQYDQNFNKYFGSLFRSGLHLSFFSMQVGRYADLYASSVVSLQHYPNNHIFLPQVTKMPHESDAPSTTNTITNPNK